MRVFSKCLAERKLPYDNPQTQGIEAGSILYAPIFLANKNPDDFVQTTYFNPETGLRTLVYIRGVSAIVRRGEGCHAGAGTADAVTSIHTSVPSGRT